MPELAEVEFYRRRWWEAGARKTVRAAEAGLRSRVFRGLEKEFSGGAEKLAQLLNGARLVDSAAHGKQMWFVFRPAKGREFLWMGVHLGMTGELLLEPPDYHPRKHDALVLRLPKRTLVFNDARQFGRVRAWLGKKGDRPPWLQKLPPEVTSAEFTKERLLEILRRHRRAPLKGVLLQQPYFPGIGNWMADEILWRAALHPALPAGRAVTPGLTARLHKYIREVARDSLRVNAGHGGKLPPDLNVNIPQSWLFHHRWEEGGRCPRTRRPLRRAEIAGRTTCWSPARQKL